MSSSRSIRSIPVNWLTTVKLSSVAAPKMMGPTPICWSELVMCHRDRLKAWKPDDQLTRELASLNEGRRNAVDRRTELANEIKSQLKLYFPLALQILDHDITTALAA